MTNDDVIVRFYEWCLLDAAREQKEGFTILRCFANDSAARFFNAIRGLSPAEQSELMSALSRRFKKRAMALRAESLSDRDIVLIDRFLSAEACCLSPRMDITKEPEGLLTAKHLEKVLKKSSILPLPLQKIVSVFGNIRMDYAYRTGSIRTDIDIGGKTRQVAFSFGLMSSTGETLIRLEDPLHWLGVGRSAWFNVRSHEAAMIVETVAMSLVRFCAAVDYILGL